MEHLASVHVALIGTLEQRAQIRRDQRSIRSAHLSRGEEACSLIHRLDDPAVYRTCLAGVLLAWLRTWSFRW